MAIREELQAGCSLVSICQRPFWGVQARPETLIKWKHCVDVMSSSGPIDEDMKVICILHAECNAINKHRVPD